MTHRICDHLMNVLNIVKQSSGGEEAGSSAGGGRRARARDMPQPHTPSTRRDKRGMCYTEGRVRVPFPGPPYRVKYFKPVPKN